MTDTKNLTLNRQETHQFQLLNGSSILRLGATRRTGFSLPHVGIGIVAHDDDDDDDDKEEEEGEEEENGAAGNGAEKVRELREKETALAEEER